MIAGQKDNLFKFFRKRKLAYTQVFSRENVFTVHVLEDLAKFCRAYETTFHPDARVQAQLEGRREVFLRIADTLNLSIEQIYDMHVAKNLKQEK